MRRAAVGAGAERTRCTAAARRRFRRTWRRSLRERWWSTADLLMAASARAARRSEVAAWRQGHQVVQVGGLCRAMARGGGPVPQQLPPRGRRPLHGQAGAGAARRALLLPGLLQPPAPERPPLARRRPASQVTRSGEIIRSDGGEMRVLSEPLPSSARRQAAQAAAASAISSHPLTFITPPSAASTAAAATPRQQLSGPVRQLCYQDSPADAAAAAGMDAGGWSPRRGASLRRQVQPAPPAPAALHAAAMGRAGAEPAPAPGRRTTTPKASGPMAGQPAGRRATAPDQLPGRAAAAPKQQGAPGSPTRAAAGAGGSSRGSLHSLPGSPARPGAQSQGGSPSRPGSSGGAGSGGRLAKASLPGSPSGKGSKYSLRRPRASSAAGQPELLVLGGESDKEGSPDRLLLHVSMSTGA